MEEALQLQAEVAEFDQTRCLAESTSSVLNGCNDSTAC